MSIFVPMLNLGKYNTLQIKRRTPNGFYLVETQVEEVLLPNKFITPQMKEGDWLKVFVYNDSENRPVATTQVPRATTDEAAYMKVKEVTGIGAFLDWGLDKDLFLPFREQAKPVEMGKYYLVYVYFDYASKRIVATTNMNKFIKNRELTVKLNEEVDLLLTEKTETGIRVIINQKHWGMLYENEIFSPLKKGIHVKGYIKKIREDNKIDVALQKQGIEAAKDVKGIILQKLEENNGSLKLNDNSPPELIYEFLGISKKNFKKAIGMLYKEKKIELEETGIRLRK